MYTMYSYALMCTIIQCTVLLVLALQNPPYKNCSKLLWKDNNKLVS